jgi:hypothetical protein
MNRQGGPRNIGRHEKVTRMLPARNAMTAVGSWKIARHLERDGTA